MTQVHPPAASVEYVPKLAAFGVLFASVCFGLVPFFSRGLMEAGLAPQAVAFYRYFIAAILLSPVLIQQRHAWREVLWGLSAGAVMGLGWIGYVIALETVPVSTVGVLYMTYPVFTVVLAWLLFADRPSRKAVAAAALIILAAVIAGNPAAVPAEQIPVLVMSLAAPFGFGFGICVLVHRLARIPPLARIAAVSLGSMLALLPLVLTSERSAIIPEDNAVWLLISGIAIFSALIPQLVYTICSPMVGTSRTAVIGSVELPTMFALGVFAYGEALTLPQAIACVLILSAILITRSRKVRSVTTNISKQ
ncbi:MAG: DMT family transporter [Sulfitobacter sp.]